VLPLIPALFSPIGLSIAAMGAAIAGGVVIARTLSPAFREETDAIMAALMRLDFGAAWEVMNINLAIALVQMHQKFAQAFDLVKNTVIAASQFMGDMLIEGLDRFMGLFGEDILTLQSGFQKLGLYFKAAFDWDFAINGMTKALNKVDSEVEKARQRAPTEDRRAADRDRQREQNAAERGAAATARDKGFDDTIKALREDDERAKRRARGEVPKVAEDPAKPGQPVKPKVPAAPPGAFMPPPETKGEKDKGLAAQGNWSGVGLDIGPEIGRLEDPAQRTANATERTAEAVGKIAAAGGDVAVPQQDAKAEVAKAAAELERLKAAKQEYDDSRFPLGKRLFELQKKAEELGVVDAQKKDFDTLKKELENNPQGGMASDAIKNAEEIIAKRKKLRARDGIYYTNDFEEKISAAESALASATAAAQQAPAADAGVMNPPMAATVPAIAMETVAPRAPAVQANAARGMETAIGAAQTGITFEQIGSEIVAAVNAGTEVSKQMLSALNKIADKKPTELAFQ
jgi:hypothetical protein